MIGRARRLPRAASAIALVVLLVASGGIVLLTGHPAVAPASPSEPRLALGASPGGNSPGTPVTGLLGPGAHGFDPVPAERRGTVGVVPAPYLGADPPLSARARAPNAPTPAGSAANPSLAELSAGASVAAVGPSNASVLVGAIDEYLYAEGSGLFWTDGWSAAFSSSNGGASWTTSWVGPNASWSDSSSPAYGDITWGADSVAGANGTALYATVYAQACAVFAVGPCNSSAEFAAPSGVAVARSTDGGAAWGAPVPINSVAEWRLDNITCSGTPYSYYIPANLSDKPSVAYAPDGRVALVGWDVIDYSDALVCTPSGLGLTYSVDDLSELAVSTNGGVSWSAPRTIGRGVSGPASVAVGPSPADTLFFSFDDPMNGTSVSFPFALSVSTNLGANWTKPVDVGAPTMVHPVTGSAAPDGWASVSLPDLAVDANSSSPYAGTAYLAWEDNRSSVPGDASIAFASGSASGGWSGVSYLTPRGGAYRYYEPSVAVDPSGRVWVVYYALNATSGAYQLVGQYSTDAGVAWSAPFAVAVNESAPAPGIGWIGYWTGAAASSAGLYAAWTDCPASVCATEDAPGVDAAHAAAVTIGASVGGVSASASSGNWTSSGATPLATAWDLSALVTVSVPPWVPLENTSRYVGVFSNFSGAISSTLDPSVFDFEGGSALTANYGFSPVGWIAGTVGPANALPVLTVDGLRVPLTPGAGGVDDFNESVLPGAVYTVVATAPGYSTVSEEVPVGIGATSPVAITLHRLSGWIVGRLTPANATLEVNGSLVTTVDPATGLFNVTTGWGSYWVNASGTGLTVFHELVTVTVGHPTEVSPTLQGGWITGTVDPANAVLTIDGGSVVVGAGAFNVSILGGSHVVEATDTGYAIDRETVTVVPGHVLALALVLTDIGWISGSVSPLTAVVFVSNARVPVIGGAFNASEPGDASYNVTVEASGFSPSWRTVAVTPAVVSVADFLLSALPACSTGCGTSNGTTTPPAASTALPYSYTDLGIAAGAILGAAVVVALVLLAARRRGPPPPGPGEEIYAPPGSPSGAAEPGPPPPSEGGPA